MHWRRKWQPTPVVLPGESQGQRGLVGHSGWGRREKTRLSDYARHTIRDTGCGMFKNSLYYFCNFSVNTEYSKKRNLKIGITHCYFEYNKRLIFSKAICKHGNILSLHLPSKRNFLKNRRKEERKKRRVGGREETKGRKWTWTLASKIHTYVNQLYLIF